MTTKLHNLNDKTKVTNKVSRASRKERSAIKTLSGCLKSRSQQLVDRRLVQLLKSRLRI